MNIYFFTWTITNATSSVSRANNIYLGTKYYNWFNSYLINLLLWLLLNNDNAKSNRETYTNTNYGICAINYKFNTKFKKYI